MNNYNLSIWIMVRRFKRDFCVILFFKFQFCGSLDTAVQTDRFCTESNKTGWFGSFGLTPYGTNWFRGDLNKKSSFTGLGTKPDRLGL